MLDQVREYYGSVLASSDDLQTNACCTDDNLPLHVKAALSQVHDEVMARYYGCGLIAPPALEGCRVLDLGCGSGRDCYVLSQLVGEQGEVVGVDMTPEQLEVARRHQQYHRERFGYQRDNTRFEQGYIEALNELELEPASFDVIVSNCVINLSPDKLAVLEQAYELLKPGGEVYFSDVYADRRIPTDLKNDEQLYGECLSGALYWNDFINLAKAAGFADPRLVEDRPITIENPLIEEKLAGYRFYSATYRLFKLDGLEPACEDYGQAVIYRGTIPHQPAGIGLDQHHKIATGKVFPVCGNTWRMLADTRLAPHFQFIGNFDQHFGIFEGCGMPLPFEADEAIGAACC